MFSIIKMKEKINLTNCSISFRKFIWQGVKDINGAIERVLILLLFSLPGVTTIPMILDQHVPFNVFYIMPILGVLSSYFITRLMYFSYSKSYKKENYFLSQQEMKDYIKTLPSKEYKKKVIAMIEVATKENKGNLNFIDFEKIYNSLEDEVKKERYNNIKETEKRKAEETSACLVKVLEDDINKDSDNSILNKERKENVLYN